MTGNDVTVITPTITTRTHMLGEAIESVHNQTIRPKEHLIMVDLHRVGVEAMVNRLADQVKTKYIQFLSDDNLLMPHHIEKMLETIGDADLCYGWPEVTGRPISFDIPWSPKRLRQGNFICEPMVKTWWMQAMGFGLPHIGSDWQFYVKMEMNDAKFVCYPHRTIIFRFGHGNYSIGTLPSDV